MTNNLPWFRVYSEILSDRKITRICARTGQPKYAVIGFWTALLAIANEATVRGLLLIADDIPLDREEIFLECGIDCETGEVLLQEFINLNMIELDEDGIYSICHWDNRQFASDNSTERVRRHRERKKEGAGQNGPGTESATPEPEKETPDGENGSGPLQSNDTPEKMKRFRNVIDTDTESDSLNKNKTRARERDFLADIVGHEKGKEGVANPADDFTAHFGYRDEALKICHELTGVYPDTQVGKPAIIALAQEAGFSLDRWRNSIRSARLAGVKANNFQCFIDTYRAGGDYKSLYRQRQQSAYPRGQPAQSSEPSPVSAAFYAKSRKH